MAVRTAKMVKTDNGMLVVTWEGLLEVGGVQDTGQGVTVGNVEGLCAQALGNFDTNAVVTLQGSNDGTTWFTIGSGTFTAANLFRTISERPLYIRPAVTTNGAGDATDVDVIMVGAIRVR